MQRLVLLLSFKGGLLTFKKNYACQKILRTKSLSLSSLRACDCLIRMVAFSPPGLLLIHIRLRFGCYIMMSQFLVFLLSLWKSSLFSRNLYYGTLGYFIHFSGKKGGEGNLLVSNVLFEYVHCFIRNNVIPSNVFWIYPIESWLSNFASLSISITVFSV